MIKEDYILRLIRLAAEFIAKALGLAREGDFLTSEKTLGNGLRDLTGLSLETLKSMEPETLETMMGGDDASVFLLAEFLQALAKVEKAKGELDLYFIFLKKSLSLYLLIRVNEDLETDKPIFTVYEEVKGVISEVGLLENLLEFYRSTGNAEECEFITKLIDDSAE